MDDPNDLEYEHVANLPGKANLGDGATIEFFDKPERCVLTQGDQRIVLTHPHAMIQLWRWIDAFRDGLFEHAKKMKATKPS